MVVGTVTGLGKCAGEEKDDPTHNGRLLLEIMMAISLVTLLITIGTQFTSIVWWPMVLSLPSSRSASS